MEEKRSERIAFFMEIYKNEEEIMMAVCSILQQTYRNIRLYICTSSEIYTNLVSIFTADERLIFIDQQICDIKTKQRGYVQVLKKIALDENDYIATLDADDWYDLNFVEKILQFVKEHQLEVAACGSRIYHDEKYIYSRESKVEYIWDNLNTPKYYIAIQSFFRPVWGKLYAASLILRLNNDAFFDSSEVYGGYGGDTMICNEILKNAKRAGVMTKTLHNYRLSFSNNASSSFNMGRIRGTQLLQESNIQLLEKYGKISMENKVMLEYMYASEVEQCIKLIEEAENSLEVKISLITQLFSLETSKFHILYCIATEKIADKDMQYRKKYREEIFGVRTEKEQKLYQKEYYEIFKLLYPDKASDVSLENFFVTWK